VGQLSDVGIIEEDFACGYSLQKCDIVPVPALFLCSLCD